VIKSIAEVGRKIISEETSFIYLSLKKKKKKTKHNLLKKKKK